MVHIAKIRKFLELKSNNSVLNLDVLKSLPEFNNKKLETRTIPETLCIHCSL